MSSMSQFKGSFRKENYVTDTVGHSNVQINYDDFNRKYREWEVRRGFSLDTSNTTPKLRGIALRTANSKSNKTKSK